MLNKCPNCKRPVRRIGWGYRCDFCHKTFWGSGIEVTDERPTRESAVRLVTQVKRGEKDED